MTTPVVTYPAAHLAALDILHDELGDYDDTFTDDGTGGVGTELPGDWDTIDATAFLVAYLDGEQTDHPIIARQTVRITAWHATERGAHDLAQLARAILLAHSGPVIRKTIPGLGPLTTIDDTSSAHLAFLTVTAVVRSVPA